MVLTRDFWCDGQTTILSHAARYLKEKVNYPAAELRGIKNQKQDVPDSDTSFIELTSLPLDHKARIFTAIFSRLRRGCIHPHSRAVEY